MAETGWGAMLRTAAVLGISPEAFWRLSLKEWRMLSAAGPGVVPMGRREVEALMAAWPDIPPPTGACGGSYTSRPQGAERSDVTEGALRETGVWGWPPPPLRGPPPAMGEE